MRNEAELKTEIRKYLKGRDGVAWFDVPGTAYGRAGAPDIVVCYRGRFVGIEAKNPNGGGVLSEDQKRARRAIDTAGGRYAVVTTVEAVAGVLADVDDAVERERDELIARGEERARRVYR